MPALQLDWHLFEVARWITETAEGHLPGKQEDDIAKDDFFYEPCNYYPQHDWRLDGDSYGHVVGLAASRA
jgi:hypothetical protein